MAALLPSAGITRIRFKGYISARKDSPPDTPSVAMRSRIRVCVMADTNGSMPSLQPNRRLEKQQLTLPESRLAGHRFGEICSLSDSAGGSDSACLSESKFVG